MANAITSVRQAGSTVVQMSNGLTSVLLDVLAIAGSDLATTPWERAFVSWLVEHDQSRTGLGCVGFDLEEMGWTADEIEVERRFVMAIIDAALRRHGWDRLPFAPREESLFAALEQLRRLVEAFPADAVGRAPEGSRAPRDLPEHGVCHVHRVYLHDTGCIVCNDAPIDASPAVAPNRSPETT